MPPQDLPDDVQRLIRRQDGVIARWQLTELDAADHDIRRLRRRRVLATVHPGVYVSHTGVPSRKERSWAAVLACWPAALAGRSALNLADDGPITVVVDRNRSLRPPAGVHLLRRSSFLHEVRWSDSPPRQRSAYAALDAVAGL